MQVVHAAARIVREILRLHWKHAALSSEPRRLLRGASWPQKTPPMHLGEKSSELVALRVLGFNQRTVSKNDTGTRMQQRVHL